MPTSSGARPKSARRSSLRTPKPSRAPAAAEPAAPPSATRGRVVGESLITRTHRRALAAPDALNTKLRTPRSARIAKSASGATPATIARRGKKGPGVGKVDVPQRRTETLRSAKKKPPVVQKPVEEVAEDNVAPESDPAEPDTPKSKRKTPRSKRQSVVAAEPVSDSKAPPSLKKNKKKALPVEDATVDDPQPMADQAASVSLKKSKKRKSKAPQTEQVEELKVQPDPETPLTLKKTKKTKKSKTKSPVVDRMDDGQTQAEPETPSVKDQPEPETPVTLKKSKKSKTKSPVVDRMDDGQTQAEPEAPSVKDQPEPETPVTLKKSKKSKAKSPAVDHMDDKHSESAPETPSTSKKSKKRKAKSPHTPQVAELQAQPDPGTPPSRKKARKLKSPLPQAVESPPQQQATDDQEKAESESKSERKKKRSARKAKSSSSALQSPAKQATSDRSNALELEPKPVSDSKPKTPQKKSMSSIKKKVKKAKQTLPARYHQLKPGQLESNSELPAADIVENTPKITMNEEMTASKLKMLQSSPLNRLIPQRDQDAAAAELVLSERKKSRKQNRERSERGSDLFAAREKDAKKIRSKARKLRSEHRLVDKDTEEDLSAGRGVLYLGHIPHGFYEKEMNGYFSQFGEVTRLRLSRSRKTARSRGYAFVEFAHADVAGIAAETMDGYMMHGQSLVAKLLSGDKVHKDTFKGANRTFRKVPWASRERRAMMARSRDPVKLAARSKRIRKEHGRKQRVLAKSNIEYEFPEIDTA